MKVTATILIVLTILAWVKADSACTNDADQKIWTATGEKNFESDLNDCGHSSMGDATKATACMVTKESYSEPCATCFGDLVGCTASKCISSCIFGHTAACAKCVDENCTPAFKTSSGLTPPSSVQNFLA